MAAMIDAKPEYRGEAKVWEALERLLPHGIMAYNNREINGREYDFCLLIEDMGVLMIEVKGWHADKITVRGVDEIVVEGYEKPQRSPKKQARAYRFTLLNRIAEEYSRSPCVFDMVCYPFISAEEYRNTRLDTVSEEPFTICREDLERADALLGKIRRAYDALHYIPHDALTPDLIVRLRQAWEPAYEPPVQEMAGTAHPYSILSVHPNEVTQAEIERMVAPYFAGTKRVVFLGDQESYARAVEAFRRAFAQRNIEPLVHGLQIGHRSGLVVGGRSFRSFHLEVYLIDHLDEITASAVSYEEGGRSVCCSSACPHRRTSTISSIWSSMHHRIAMFSLQQGRARARPSPWSPASRFCAVKRWMPSRIWKRRSRWSPLRMTR